MRIAVTGGTGFVGRNVVRLLSEAGNEVVLISRGVGPHDPTTLSLPGVQWARVGVADTSELRRALEGCEGVVHCAGINRELGAQTYEAVHIAGTRHVVESAGAAGVRRIVMLSFLRARPACGSPYHESKFAAEEIVRGSGLEYTVLKAGVIYGRGDHMLDHLSHALFTFPIFALVGFQDRPVRPVAVQDVARICVAALTDSRLTNATVAVLGPDTLLLGDVVRQVAAAVGRRRPVVRAPVRFHQALAHLTERLMVVPLASLAQVRILSEGVTEPVGAAQELPTDLLPTTPFTLASIRAGLPDPGRFTRRDLRPCVQRGSVAEA